MVFLEDLGDSSSLWGAEKVKLANLRNFVDVLQNVKKYCFTFSGIPMSSEVQQKIGFDLWF